LAIVLAGAVDGGSLPPLVFEPLRWNASAEEAVAALTRAQMSPRQEMRRGYFPTGGSGPVGHTSEPEIIFVPRPGWMGDALFTWHTDRYQLAHVTLTAELDEAVARAELAALEQSFGPPTSKTSTPTELRRWTRGGFSLAAAVGTGTGSKKFLSVTFARNP
jgi:hypothetical protein